MDLKEYLRSNYLRALQAQLSEMDESGDYEVTVLHEDACGIFVGGACDCDCTVLSRRVGV